MNEDFISKSRFQAKEFSPYSTRYLNTFQNTSRGVQKGYKAQRMPSTLSFTANFTNQHRSYDIGPTLQKMRKDPFQASKKKHSSEHFDSTKAIPSDNPIYEDPRDVIGEKSARRMNAHTLSSPRLSRESKIQIKHYKKKLSKKYENLIMTLMERCEENITTISSKESQISKLKEKLKEVLEYNKLFAEENDQLKGQHSAMILYVEDCKRMTEDMHVKTKELETRNIDLNEKMKQFEIPDRDYSGARTTAVPLVEVCMSCSSREILLRQARDHNTRLQLDMQALKDVLYRLNVQLSRYQQKIRSNIQNIAREQGTPTHGPGHGDNLDSFLNSLNYKQQEDVQIDENRLKQDNDGDQKRVTDLSGLLSAQALGPLFDAYQESIQEKENLILDYEKQFETINRKSKEIVAENKDLKEHISTIEEANSSLRQNLKKISVDKETLDIDRNTLLERCEKAECKLKEVYELYEDKMATMMRDYETVHREYFATKSALTLAEGKVASLDAALRAPGMRTVPADLHERRVDSCKRLLEDLKHQYNMDTERKNELISRLQQEKNDIDEKYKELCASHNTAKTELSTALKNVRLYRKAAVIFRQRLKANIATLHTLRKSHRRNKVVVKQCVPAVTHTQDKLDKIKQEIKTVKARAYSSLEELERRIKEQERRATQAEYDHQRELDRAHLVLEHKERIIRSLIDKVADVEEIRLSQTNAQYLQGFKEEQPADAAQESKREPLVKLTHGPGGYFQDFGREVLRKK